MLLNILLIYVKRGCNSLQGGCNSIVLTRKETVPYFCLIHIIDFKIKICLKKYSVCKVCYFPENLIFHNQKLWNRTKLDKFGAWGRACRKCDLMLSGYLKVSKSDSFLSEHEMFNNVLLSLHLF